VIGPAPAGQKQPSQSIASPFDCRQADTGFARYRRQRRAADAALLWTL